jgi:hypothetical protein
LRSETILHDIGNNVPLEVRKVDSHRDDATNDDTNKDCACLADVETVKYWIDEREDLRVVNHDGTERGVRWLTSKKE